MHICSHHPLFVLVNLPSLLRKSPPTTPIPTRGTMYSSIGYYRRWQSVPFHSRAFCPHFLGVSWYPYVLLFPPSYTIIHEEVLLEHRRLDDIVGFDP